MIGDETEAAPEAVEPQESATAPAEDALAPLRTQLDEAKKALDDSQARLRAVSKAYHDQQAEMAAFRERTEAAAKTRETKRAFEVVRGFFEPVQNLRRSIREGEAEESPLVEGLRMILTQFDDSLKRLGLERIAGEGAPFDPRVHEALVTQPVDDKALDNKVVAVCVDGFHVHGMVIQAAQVIVGQYTAPLPPEEPAPEAAAPSDAPAEDA
jgi:molecular chaperone GrpE